MSEHIEYSFNVVNVEGGFLIEAGTKNGWRRWVITRESGVKSAMKQWLDQINDTSEMLNEG